MTDVLKSRGPDDKGIWIDKKDNICLGHRRLSIIELSNLGKQPMTSHNNRFVVTYNGEIYNFVELRQTIGQSKFNTRSDCEAPLLLFENQGGKFAEDLRGMYAVSILAGDTGEVYLSRDRFGIKPLYICENNRGLSFASELQALVEAGIIKPVLNTFIRDQLLQQQFRYLLYHERVSWLPTPTWLI